jgi:hypothetical protein
MRNWKRFKAIDPSLVFDAVKRPVQKTSLLEKENFNLGIYPLNGPLRSKEGIITMSGLIIPASGFAITEAHSNN